MRWHSPGRSALKVAGLLLVAGWMCCGCGRDEHHTTRPSPPHGANQGTASGIELPQVDQKPGTAVVLLVDTSGSMKKSVRGADGPQPKHLIAAAVMQQVIETTSQYLTGNPEQHLEFGIISFAGQPNECLAIGKFDRQAALAGVERVPAPLGDTAIGRAITSGFQALYSTGCVRKYLVCVTDGENTHGPKPEQVAKQLFDQTQGEVEIHFVAFDTDSKKFRFLQQVNGFVGEAADGEQLSQRLIEIYEKRILAEAPAELEQ